MVTTGEKQTWKVRGKNWIGQIGSMKPEAGILTRLTSAINNHVPQFTNLRKQWPAWITRDRSEQKKGMESVEAQPIKGE